MSLNHRRCLLGLRVFHISKALQRYIAGKKVQSNISHKSHKLHYPTLSDSIPLTSILKSLDIIHTLDKSHSFVIIDNCSSPVDNHYYTNNSFGIL
jgi:hypothetical protein